MRSCTDGKRSCWLAGVTPWIWHIHIVGCCFKSNDLQLSFIRWGIIHMESVTSLISEIYCVVMGLIQIKESNLPNPHQRFILFCNLVYNIRFHGGKYWDLQVTEYCQDKRLISFRFWQLRHVWRHTHKQYSMSDQLLTVLYRHYTA